MLEFILKILFMRLLTLIAGYAAGLAVAMKYRKDAGKSKLDTTSGKPTMDSLIDEVVDMHKSAFADVKWIINTYFDDVNDFDSLKSKVTGMIDGFVSEAETRITALKSKGETKADEVMGEVDALFEEKNELLEAAREKGSSFADVAFDTLSGWIDEAKSKLATARSTVESKIKTPPVKKAPAKKSVAKKAPAKQ